MAKRYGELLADYYVQYPLKFLEIDLRRRAHLTDEDYDRIALAIESNGGDIIELYNSGKLGGTYAKSKSDNSRVNSIKNNRQDFFPNIETIDEMALTADDALAATSLVSWTTPWTRVPHAILSGVVDGYQILRDILKRDWKDAAYNGGELALDILGAKYIRTLNPIVKIGDKVPAKTLRVRSKKIYIPEHTADEFSVLLLKAGDYIDNTALRVAQTGYHFGPENIK